MKIIWGLLAALLVVWNLGWLIHAIVRRDRADFFESAKGVLLAAGLLLVAVLELWTLAVPAAVVFFFGYAAGYKKRVREQSSNPP